MDMVFLTALCTQGFNRINGPAISTSSPQHVFGEFCLWTFSFSMSETALGLLLLECSCDSLDIWKYKRENGCQVFLLHTRWEMKSPLLLGVVCVLLFLIILVIQSLKIRDPVSILSQKGTSHSTTYLITQIKCILKSPKLWCLEEMWLQFD